MVGPVSVVRYVIRRLTFGLVLVFVASSFSFLLTHAAPGDATMDLVRPGVSPETVARERVRLGLDDSLGVQYARWLGRAVRLDLGYSVFYGRPVWALLQERLGNTAALAATALSVATVIGVGLGAAVGAAPAGFWPSVAGVMSMAAVSVPPLLASLMLVYVAARTGWFPVGGLSSPGMESAGWIVRLLDLGWHLALPSLAIAVPLTATIERLQSRSMAETLGQPYVRAAMARGVSWRRIVWRHALPVAIRPVLGVYGVILGSVFSGSFIVEYVSAWPGLGRLMYDALIARDTYLAAGCAVAGSSCLALGTFLSDVALFASDPRLRADR